MRSGGVMTVLATIGTLACGLLLIGGFGPAPAGIEPAGDRVPLASRETTLPVTTPATTTPATTTLATTVTTAAPMTAPETTTAVATIPEPSAPVPIGPPATDPALVSPVPLSVSPDSVTVGAGGTARISGTCATVAGVARGPVVIWEVGEAVSVIATGVTAAAWSYDWTAPAVIAPIVLQAWCGDPSTYQGGYPDELQVEVVFVAQEAPPSTSTTSDPAVAPVIPATD